MGNVASRDIFANKTGPNAGPGLDTLGKNQGAFRETLGALPPKDVTILDGAISGFEEAALIVDTEGGAAADDLAVISDVITATEKLHPGMLITLRAKDPARVVTIKNSVSPNGINTADGNDIVLSPDWELPLRLVGGRWYEVRGRSSALADAAQANATTALERTAPATTTSRGIGRVATLADMEPGAVVGNGPAFLAAVDVVPVIEKWRFVVGEFYYFRHPTIKPGFAAAQGGLISGAYQGKDITEYPIWAYLQTAEGQLLCKSEAQWQAMTTATWHTNADGTKIGWDGIGGAPFYVQDLGAGTLRMPDLRGMYAEAAGFDSLGVGGVQSPGLPDITGTVHPGGALHVSATAVGAFWLPTGGESSYLSVISGGSQNYKSLNISASRSNSIYGASTSVQPKAWGALACAYLGTPAAS